MVIKRRISNIYKIRKRKKKIEHKENKKITFISFTRILKRQNLILFAYRIYIRDIYRGTSFRKRHRIQNSLTKYN